MTAGAIPRGQIEWGIVSPDIDKLAAALQEFFIIGSKKSLVSIDDLTIVSDQMPLPEKFTTASEAIKGGTKLIDALYYFSIDAARRPKILRADDGNKAHDRDPVNIAKAFFYQCFFVLTRGAPSTDKGTQRGGVVPSFLQATLALNESPFEYANKICSFDIGNVDWQLIKHLKFDKLGQQALSRFGIGLAGYRMISPFRYYKVRDDASEEVKSAVQVMRHLAESKADWSIHSVTRSATVMGYYGSINKCAGNLILEAFTDEQITEMVKSRMIYAKPVHEPRYSQWRTWSLDRMPGLKNPIFQGDK